MKKIILFIASLAFAVPSFAQTALTTTTITATVTGSQTNVPVSSATGIVAPSFVGNPTQTGGTSTVLLIDNEEMVVRSVQGTQITVQRGASGTTATSHASGSNVFVLNPAANPSQILAADPAGYCIAANTVSPTVVANNAYHKGVHLWNCIGSTWEPYLSSGTITPTATTAAVGTYGQTFTVAGLASGEPIVLTSYPAQTSLCPVTGARTTAANTVTLYFSTLTAAACTPAAGTYLFSVPRFSY